MSIILYILSSLAYGVVCSIPGIMFGYLLGEKGIVRNSPWWVIVMSTLGVFGLRIFFPSVSIWIILIVLSLTSPFIYRHDLWNTWVKGKWWWVKKDGD